jgi:hypothetical protein
MAHSATGVTYFALMYPYIYGNVIIILIISVMGGNA